MAGKEVDWGDDVGNEIVASCGCVYCDLQLEPEVIDGKPMHAVYDDRVGNAGFVECTRQT